MHKSRLGRQKPLLNQVKEKQAKTFHHRLKNTRSRTSRKKKIDTRPENPTHSQWYAMNGRLEISRTLFPCFIEPFTTNFPFKRNAWLFHLTVRAKIASSGAINFSLFATFANGSSYFSAQYPHKCIFNANCMRTSTSLLNTARQKSNSLTEHFVSPKGMNGKRIMTLASFFTGSNGKTQQTKKHKRIGVHVEFAMVS